MRQKVIIGLDGTPFSFLKKEMVAGNLPNFSKLDRNGGFHQMETEIPTISSVAWASFMTGKNPAEHGIFGFTDRKPHTYDLYFPNYSHLKAKPFWDRLSEQGRRCCVLNVPSTYPARPINGVLVSGFVAPTIDRAVYPNEALEYLRSIDYRIDVDASKGRESLDLLLEDLHATLEKRREAIFHFWRQENWDLFVAVFTGTDRLHHFFWRHYEDCDPVYQQEFLKFYRRVDEIVAEFIEEIPNESQLFMLSDHGFCKTKKLVFLNRWLEQQGYLQFKSDEPKTIADIDPGKTVAYCMDPGRIYINLRGREPDGIISRGDDYDAVINRLEGSLARLVDPDTGERIINRIFRNSELFSGPLIGLSPDLVIDPVRGYDFKGAMNREVIIPVGHLTGMHTYDDAFFYSRDDVELPEKLHIRNLAQIISG